VPIGGPWSLWGLGLVFVYPLEGHRRGVLMQPWGRDGLHLQRLERNRSKHTVEIRRQPRIEAVPSPVISERGPRSPRLKQCHHPALFQPSPDLVEGMIPIQNREDHGFDPTPTRDHRCRVRRDEAIDDCGDLQAPSYSQNQGQMRHRMNLLH
jgi:hypothetical protein